MFTPSRLVLARKRRRMTLAGLHRASGISVRSLTAFENGHKAPSPETLSSLASALRVPDAFLNADAVDELQADAVSFRALSKMSALDRDAALSSGSVAKLLNDWLEDRFRLPQPDVPTFPHLSPEEAAEQLRGRWGLGEAPIPNMIHLLESRGVRVFSLPPDCRDVDAFSTTRKGTPYIFLNTQKSGERGRFDAAHELGHLILHSEHRIPHGVESEQEAQRFASSFLMPRAGILAQMLMNASTERILSAKRKWGVAAIALTYRLRELNLLTEWGYRTAAKQLSQMGFRRSEPGGISRETSQLLTKAFEALRDQGVSAKEIAEAIDVFPDELNNFVFGLVPIALEGGGESVTAVRPSLRMVK
ncbi:helix-turn-helix domain-containing protein [Streptomyces sp. NPDC090023]|uniref:helix-turn-helix domain-containing protein n=1 Tax=Streptomyces sp. NPDC090023 TaxID=3365921 RepID=UPI003805809E